MELDLYVDVYERIDLGIMGDSHPKMYFLAN